MYIFSAKLVDIVRVAKPTACTHKSERLKFKVEREYLKVHMHEIL
jgi:hypothetical protein